MGEKKEVVTPNEKPKGNFIPLLITGAFEHKTYEDKPDEYLPYALLSEAFDDSKMKYYVEELEDASIMSASFILLDKGTSEEETNEEETNDIEEDEDEMIEEWNNAEEIFEEEETDEEWENEIKEEEPEEEAEEEEVIEEETAEKWYKTDETTDVEETEETTTEVEENKQEYEEEENFDAADAIDFATTEVKTSAVETGPSSSSSGMTNIIAIALISMVTLAFVFVAVHMTRKNKKLREHDGGFAENINSGRGDEKKIEKAAPIEDGVQGSCDADSSLGECDFSLKCDESVHPTKEQKLASALTDAGDTFNDEEAMKAISFLA